MYFTQELAKIYIMEADSSVDVSAEVSASVVMSALVKWLQVVCTGSCQMNSALVQ